MPDSQNRNLTEKQQRKLQEFRSAVQDVLKPDHDDHFLLRWLRARKFNVNAAEHMLRNSLAWRKTFGVDEIFEYKFPELMVKYTVGGIAGHDKEGCPIFILNQSDHDIHAYFRTFKKWELFKYFISHLEILEDDLRKQTRKLGKPIETIVVILDFEDLPFSHYTWKPVFELLVVCLKAFEANYPERLKKCFAINTPSYMTYGYSLVKPFLSEETRKKVFMFGKHEEWKEALLQDIDASELPQHWGGTKVDPDGNPKCPSLVAPGGKLPLSSIVNAEEHFLKYPNSKRVVIDASSCLCVTVSVEECESVITWEFMTEDYDIGFGVFRQGESKSKQSPKKQPKYEEIPVLPITRMNCHLVPEEGFLICEMPGTYVLKFDNSYSWYHKKTVFYNVLVSSPSTK